MSQGAEATVCPICGRPHGSGTSCEVRIGSEPDRTRLDSPLRGWTGQPNDTPSDSPSDTPARTRERRPEGVILPGESTDPISIEPGSDELQRGVQIGEFVVQGRVGAGGMGVVYRAIHPLIGKKAVIKVIRAGLGGDAEHVQRFIREARAVNQIGHPNIVDVFSFGLLPDKRPYLVMEWLQGESLANRLERGRIPMREAIEILLQIISALDAAHTYGVIHRDLKPDNVYLVALPNDEKPLVKLLDFGLAKITEAHKDLFLGDDEEGVILGTPSYLSPEVARGTTVDHRSDIYALGVLAYEMLSGRRPFIGRTPRETIFMHVSAAPPSARTVDPTIPAIVDTLLLEMLAKTPEQRPTLSRIRATLGTLTSQLELVAAADVADEDPTGARTADFKPFLRKLATERPGDWPELSRHAAAELEEPSRDEPPREVTRTDTAVSMPPRRDRSLTPSGDRLSAVGIVLPAHLPPAMPALVAEDLESRDDRDATRLEEAARVPRKPVARALGSMPSISVPSREDSRSEPAPPKPKSSARDSVPSLPRLPLRTGPVWRLRSAAKRVRRWLTALFESDRRRRAAIVTGVILMSLVLAFVATRRDPHADEVKLWVHGLPPGATMSWGGVPLHENPTYVPRSDASRQLTIVSPGYDTVNVPLVPTRDIDFNIEPRATK